MTVAGAPDRLETSAGGMSQTAPMPIAPDLAPLAGPDPDVPVVQELFPPGSYRPGALIGGPLGRHARRGVLPTLFLLVIVTVLACLAGYAQKFPCRDVGNWKHNYQYTRVCYSDILPLYSTEKLSDGKTPYIDTPVEYPVVIGAAMQGAAKVAELAPSDNFIERNATFFDATAILLTIAALIAVLCTALTAGRRRMDAILLAAAPLLAFHAFTNWDLLAVAFAAAGLLAWSKKAPAVAGLLFGFGAATKAYPLLILLALGLLAYRAGRLRVWARCVAFAVGALVVTYAVVWPFAGQYVGDDGTRHNNLWKFVDLNQKRGADWDSLAYVVEYLGRTTTSLRIVVVSVVIGGIAVIVAALWRQTMRAILTTAGVATLLAILVTGAAGYARGNAGVFSASTLNWAGEIGMVIALVAIGFVVLTAPRRPRVPQVAFLVVAAFLLVNKVDSPQYSLWLLPLAVLAYPRWKPLLAWQFIEIFEVVMRYLWFVFDDSTAHGKAGVSEGWFVSAVVLRQAAVLVLAGLIVRDIYRPKIDLVREAGVDDPAGGLLDGVPDRHVFE
jgi:uncharacterized membrane protein